MTERAMQKMLAPLGRRLQNMFARGTVAISKPDSKMQTLQINLLAGETLDQIEHFEPYGFTSRPKAGAEVATLFIDGERSHGIVLVAADRRYRMTGFKDGEVAIHDDKGQSVHFTEDGIVVKGGGLPMIFEDTPSMTFKADNFIRFEAPRVETTQLLRAQQLTIGGVTGGIGAATATMTGGSISYSSVTTTYTGGSITHNGHRIDDQLRVTGVVAGGANSGTVL
jgi:phage baseplate assembly protein V